VQRILSVVIAALALAGCQQSPAHPTSTSTAGGSLQANIADKPEVDPTWANGVQVSMIGPHLIVGARESQPELYAHAEELYLVVFPQASVPQPGAGPITLMPSMYQPQCNPCFHPGLPFPFVYHDHVITGAPGHGTNGTAGEFKAPWKIILVQYDPTYLTSKNFHPLTSADAVDAAEHPGLGILQVINPTGANPYEIETGNVLICPIVSGHA
jgi:hypothetical protein